MKEGGALQTYNQPNTSDEILFFNLSLNFFADSAINGFSNFFAYPMQPCLRMRGHGTHECPGCGKRYVQRSHLNQHIKWECGKPKQFKCPHCPYATKLKYNLKSHVGRRHPS